MSTLALGLDGTAGTRSSGTAVYRLHTALRRAGVESVYLPGVHGFGGMLWGKGFDDNVNHCLSLLEEIEPDRLLILGYSRGGAAAIALANEAAKRALLPVDTLLCLFDPVRSLAPWIAARWDFSVPPCRTNSALARDEDRLGFWPITWTKDDLRSARRYAEVWSVTRSGRLRKVFMTLSAAVEGNLPEEEGGARR